MLRLGDLDELGLGFVALRQDGHLVLTGCQETVVVAILNCKSIVQSKVTIMKAVPRLPIDPASVTQVLQSAVSA